MYYVFAASWVVGQSASLSVRQGGVVSSVHIKDLVAWSKAGRDLVSILTRLVYAILGADTSLACIELPMFHVECNIHKIPG